MGGFASKPSAYDTPVDVPSKYFKDFEATLPSMRGKTVVITGCTTGCGFVAARTMAHAGADVYLLNRPSERVGDAGGEETAFKASIAIDFSASTARSDGRLRR